MVPTTPFLTVSKIPFLASITLSFLFACLKKRREALQNWRRDEGQVDHQLCTWLGVNFGLSFASAGKLAEIWQT
jgi:hypothetical protein